MRMQVIGASVVVVAVIVTAALSFSRASADISLDDLRTCFSKGIDQQLACFEPIVRDMLTHETPYDLAASIEKKFPLECHAILHIVGRRLYKTTTSVEEALAQCPITCHSGCKHGVVGAVFSDSIIDEREGKGIWHPDMGTILYEAKKLCTGADECHTVGHILFQAVGFITGTLKQCDVVGKDSELAMCYRGAFMESMQQNISFIEGMETPAISYRDPSDMLAPCDKFPSRYSRACYHFLHIHNRILFKEQGIADTKDQERIFKVACATIGSEWDRASCYEGFGFEFKVVDDCSDIPRASDRAACVFGVSHVLSSDPPRVKRGIEACGKVEESLSKTACYQSIFISADTRSVLPLSELCNDAADPQCKKTLAGYMDDPHDLVFDPRIILPDVPLPSESSLHPIMDVQEDLQ